MRHILSFVSRLWGPTVPEPAKVKIEIRAARPDDATSVVELLAGDRPLEGAKLIGHRLQAPRNCGATSCVRECACVAVSGGRVVGIMSYDLLRRAADVVELYVHPDFRGLGVGSQMLALLAEHCQHVGRVLVCTARGRDVEGLKWLARRGLRPLLRASGRAHVEQDAFGDDDAVFLELRPESELSVPSVRIAR